MTSTHPSPPLIANEPILRSFKGLAKLGPGLKVGEVWISGDGRTIYATSDDGKRVVVVGSDGSGEKSVPLPSLAGGFVASEHG